MYVTNIKNEYDNITSSISTDISNDYDNITFNNCTNIETEDINNIFKYLLFSIPSSIILLFLLFS